MNSVEFGVFSICDVETAFEVSPVKYLDSVGEGLTDVFILIGPIVMEYASHNRIYHQFAEVGRIIIEVGVIVKTLFYIRMPRDCGYYSAHEIVSGCH